MEFVTYAIFPDRIQYIALVFFFLNQPATTETSPLPLHAALPITWTRAVRFVRFAIGNQSAPRGSPARAAGRASPSCEGRTSLQLPPRQALLSTEPRRESPQQHAGIAPTWKPIVQTARTSALARALPMTQTVNLALTNCSLRDEPRGTPVRPPLLAPRGASKPLRRCSRIEPSRRGSESR